MLDFLSKLTTVKGPWLFRAGNISDIKKLDGIVLMNGKNMNSYNGFYDEFAKAFKFPELYGKNLNALSEMLADLSWFKKERYIILIENGSSVLSTANNDALEGFLELLEEIGEEWSQPVIQGEEWDRPSIPFNTVIQVDSIELSEIYARLPDIFNH